MSQAMYTASDDRVVTLYDTSNANPSSATFEGSTLEMDSFSVRTYFSNSGRCHRLSSWLANKWRAVLFTLILVFLIAIFGILLYDQLHKDHSSTFPDPSSSTTVKPAIGEAVEGIRSCYCCRQKLLLLNSKLKPLLLFTLTRLPPPSPPPADHSSSAANLRAGDRQRRHRRQRRPELHPRHELANGPLLFSGGGQVPGQQQQHPEHSLESASTQPRAFTI